MADDARKDEQANATHRTTRPKHPYLKQESLPDDVVEQAKEAILFGVGYKRPPESTRFKKGRSGNPKGRPKMSDLGIAGSRSAHALTLREAERPLTVREGDETRQITTIEAIFRAQIKSAAGGSAYAQKHFIERYDRAERSIRQQITESNEFWRGYVTSYRKAIAQAERKGEEPPSLLPHLDDVITDEDKFVRFIGPVDEEGAAELEKKRKLRDLLLMQDALDRREVDDTVSHDPLDHPGTALLFATILNNGIPARFRLSDIEMISGAIRYEVMPKRELLKALNRAWRDIRRPLPRGYLFPPLRWGKQMVEMIVGLSRETSAR